jgi:hypothetical protein
VDRPAVALREVTDRALDKFSLFRGEVDRFPPSFFAAILLRDLRSWAQTAHHIRCDRDRHAASMNRADVRREYRR